MLCKHCGTTLKSSTISTNIPILVGRTGNHICYQSPGRKHIGCSGKPMVCKYCGSDLKSSTIANNIPILWGRRGGNCPQSPHGKHELAE